MALQNREPAEPMILKYEIGGNAHFTPFCILQCFGQIWEFSGRKKWFIWKLDNAESLYSTQHAVIGQIWNLKVVQVPRKSDRTESYKFDPICRVWSDLGLFQVVWKFDGTESSRFDPICCVWPNFKKIQVVWKFYVRPNMLCVARFVTFESKLCESQIEPKVLDSTQYAVCGQIWKFFNFCESSAFDPICCAWPDL